MNTILFLTVLLSGCSVTLGGMLEGKGLGADKVFSGILIMVVGTIGYCLLP